MWSACRNLHDPQHREYRVADCRALPVVACHKQASVQFIMIMLTRLFVYVFVIHHHLPLNREGRWGTIDDFATSFFHFSLFSTALWDLQYSRPVHSLMLSSHLFLCLPCLFLPFTVPCKMVLARPDERGTRPYNCSLRLFTMVRRSSCGPIACCTGTKLQRTDRQISRYSFVDRFRVGL